MRVDTWVCVCETACVVYMAFRHNNGLWDAHKRDRALVKASHCETTL